MAIYIMPGFKDAGGLLEQLGPHKHSVSCLYLTNLDNNNMSALKQLVRQGLAIMKERYQWQAT